MSTYHGTFSCGHEGDVYIIGPHKDRQWKADARFRGLCEECYQKQLEENRIKANEEAAEKAKEMELPELTGSEKQIAWANTLRQKVVESFGEAIESTREKRPTKSEKLSKILDYILINKTAAKYYIDNRFDNVDDYAIREKEEALKTDEEKIEEQAFKEIKLESTVFPDNKVTDEVVEINYTNDKIAAQFERNDTVREIVKNLNFKWNGTVWSREIKEITGTAEDRAAELGNKLLNAGFPIMILDETVRSNAVNGIYEPECNRWVMLRTDGEYKGQFAIKWWEKNDKLYRTAKSILGAHWNNGYMILKILHYKDVEDFAKLYEFKFTQKALKAMEEYKEQLQNATFVNPVEVQERETKDGLQEILNSGSEILDDLKD